MVFVVAALPILFILQQIHSNQLNVPFMDEWDQSVRIALKAASGELRFVDLFSQHNEHRTLVNNITVAVLTWISHWDIRVQFYLNFLIVIGSMVVVLDLIRRSSNASLELYILPITYIFFSARQKDNWHWGFQMQWFVLVFCLFAGLWIVKVFKPSWKSVVTVCILAFLGSFSISSGLLLWPLFGVLLYLQGYRRKRDYLLFIALSIISLFFFFHDYDTFSIGKDASGSFILDPIILGKYLFIYMGSPFEANDYIVSFWIGWGGFVLFGINLLALYLSERQARTAAPWIVSAGFALGTGLITAIGRARLFLQNPNQPLTSRYVTMANPFWIALLALTVFAYFRTRATGKEHRWRVALTGVNLVSIFLLTGFYLHANSEFAKRPWPIDRRQEECVRYYPIYRNDQCLAGLYPDTKLITDRILLLADYELTIFQEDIASDELQLERAPLEFIGPQTLTQYQPYVINGVEEEVLFQHAPSLAEQTIQIPSTSEIAVFHFGIYVEPDNFNVHPEIPQDGVEFQLKVRDEGGNSYEMFQGLFNPVIDQEPKFFEVDFSEFKGRLITIQFGVSARENPTYDWSMWVNPRIALR